MLLENERVKVSLDAPALHFYPRTSPTGGDPLSRRVAGRRRVAPCTPDHGLSANPAKMPTASNATTKAPQAVLLGRVSRGERTQDPEAQLAPLRAVADRLGWNVVEEVPLKISAWDDKAAAEVRRRCFKPIEEGRADMLAVWALDRVCREGVEEVFSLLRKLEHHYGAKFYSLQEPFLSTGTDPQQRELLLSIMAWMARWESQRRSQRLKARAASKRARAEAGGGRARWGRGKMASNADKMLVARLRSRGSTIRQIAAQTGLSVGAVHNLLHEQP